MDNTSGKVIKCLAAVIWKANDKLSVEEIEVHPPQKGEVRIKILFCGICHSDIHGIDGKIPNSRFPGILGHEASGIVESAGPGVTSFKEGDKVVPVFNPQCNACPFCKDPNTNFCATSKIEFNLLKDGSSRYISKGQKLSAFCKVSSFSQYIVTSENSCVKVGKDAPLDKICLLSCGIPTGYGSALNIAKVTPGSTCAIWGLGTIGLAVAMGCKAKGASRIIGIDTNPEKKQTSKTFGVTEFVNPKDHKEPINEVLQKMTILGCDFTFECIGRVETIKSAFQSCRVGGGKCVVVGVTSADAVLSLSPLEFLFSKTLTGTLYGGYKPKESVPQLVKDYQDKKILLDEFITGKIPLKDINKGIDLLLEGKALRTVVEMF